MGGVVPCPANVRLNDEEVPYTVSLDLSRRIQSSNVNLYLVKVREREHTAHGLCGAHHKVGNFFFFVPLLPGVRTVRSIILFVYLHCLDLARTRRQFYLFPRFERGTNYIPEEQWLGVVGLIATVPVGAFIT